MSIKKQSKLTLWTAAEVNKFRALKSPEKVQEYLDQLRYRYTGIPQSARYVLKNKTANCFDGAVLGAAALEQLGYVPYLMDLRAVQDDDHILAVFKRNACFGAVAKSNYSGLRYREPVYKSLRELAMSYFENYFNLSGKRTMREYSELFDLRKEKKINWRTGTGSIEGLAEPIDALRHHRVMSKAAEKNLVRMDDRSIAAGKYGRARKNN